MGWTVLAERTPVARVEHSCHWCFEAIKVGEKHVYWAGTWGPGEFAEMKVHEDCDGAYHRARHDAGIGSMEDEQLECFGMTRHGRGERCDECGPDTID